jgi:hypothetical protein
VRKVTILLTEAGWDSLEKMAAEHSGDRSTALGLICLVLNFVLEAREVVMVDCGKIQDRAIELRPIPTLFEKRCAQVRDEGLRFTG